MSLSDLHERFLMERGLDPETAVVHGGLYSGRSERGKVVPDPNGDVLVFPYWEAGVEVNAKYRGRGKQFWQKGGGKKTFYNADILDDPQLEIGTVPLIIVEGECFPGYVEVLTVRGWVPFSEYSGEAVAAVRPDWSADFVEPLAVVRKPYTGALVRYEHKQWKSVTTPDHMLVGIDQKGGWRKFPARALASCGDLVPRVAVVDGPGIGLSREQVALCIAVSADATIDDRSMTGRVMARGRRYARFAFKKARKVERLKALLGALDIPFCEGVHSGEYIGVGFTLPDWVPGRFLPWEWIANASADERSHILDELVHWDGNRVLGRQQTEYSTKYRENADWVQALAHTSGVCSTIMHRRNGFGEWYKVSVLHGKRHSSMQNCRRSEQMHDGLVHCVSVPSGMILIRCEGSVSVSGNCDALALIQAGFPHVVSVPDGAPPARDSDGRLIAVPEDADDVAPEEDSKFAFVLNNWERLRRVRQIILASDGDEPGWRLAQELARRLGRSRCLYVTYPGQVIEALGRPCKDAGEVLQHLGDDALAALVDSAREFPVRGLYKLSDFPDEGPIKTLSIGLPRLEPEIPTDPVRSRNPHLSLYKGAFVVCSGLPGGGKSILTTQVAYNMARLHGWKVAIASPEMPVKPVIQDMLRGFYIRRPDPHGPWLRKHRNHFSKAERAEADAFIEHYFSFISLMPDDDESDADIDWVIDRANDAVLRYGIDMLLLDPWNEYEHKRRHGESVADYLNRALRSLKRFAVTRDVCTVVVAHPTKSAAWAARHGEGMSLHDISDGSAWANKAELGLIVSRESAETTRSIVAVRKVKFKGTGRLGEVDLVYDEEVEAFI